MIIATAKSSAFSTSHSISSNSMEYNGGAKPLRRNSFQRMLQLEKKNKLDRMRLSVVEAIPPQTSTKRSKIISMNHPAALESQSQGQPKAATNLSLSITPSSRAPPDLTTHPQILEKLESDVGLAAMKATLSDTSSICQSPGWDDTESRKRRKAKQEAKDKRRREEEKAAIEAKKQRTQKRLTKAPPTSRRASNLSSPIPRFKSAAVGQLLSGQRNGTDEPERKGGNPSIDGRSRRFIPWKPATSTSAVEGHKPSEGFIGGVKLQQAAYATIQATDSKHKVTAVYPHKSKFAEEFPSRESDGDSRQENEEYGPIMENNTQTTRKSRIQAPDSTFQQAQLHTEEAISATPLEPTSKHTINGGSFSRFSQPSPVSFSEGPPVSYREPPQFAAERGRTRRGSFGFWQIQTQSSNDTSANPFQDESRASIATSTVTTERHSRGRSWSFLRGSRTSSRPTTADTVQSTGSKNNYSHLTEIADGMRLARDTGSVQESLSSGLNVSGPTRLQSLSIAAKAVLSRKFSFSKSAPIPLGPFQTLTTEKERPVPFNHRVAESPKHSVLECASQAAKVLPDEGHRTEGYRHFHPSERSSNGKSPGVGQLTGIDSGQANKDAESSISNDSGNGQDSNQSSSNNSSDEYHSAVGESTITSTLAASRPQSEIPHPKERGPNSDGKVNRANATTPVGRSCQIVGGSVNDDEAPAARYEQHQNMSPTPRKQDKKPFQNKTSAREGSSSAKPQPISNSSRSSSSTDPQDLGFLRTLRHQPLYRVAKGKGEDVSLVNYPDRPTQNPEPSCIAPTPPTPPSSSSSSSPASPVISSAHSAQYLQNARQSLPPPSSTPRPSLVSSSSKEPNTLAKMFVICCRCRYFHDMPSKIYECMAKPDSVISDRDLGVSGVISTHVKCPWCGHGMNTMCCEGWAAVVLLRERLH